MQPRRCFRRPFCPIGKETPPAARTEGSEDPHALVASRLERAFLLSDNARGRTRSIPRHIPRQFLMTAVPLPRYNASKCPPLLPLNFVIIFAAGRVMYKYQGSLPGRWLVLLSLTPPADASVDTNLRCPRAGTGAAWKKTCDNFIPPASRCVRGCDGCTRFLLSLPPLNKAIVYSAAAAAAAAAAA